MKAEGGPRVQGVTVDFHIQMYISKDLPQFFGVCVCEGGQEGDKWQLGDRLGGTMTVQVDMDSNGLASEGAVRQGEWTSQD